MKMEEPLIWENLSVEKNIQIVINTIENVVRRDSVSLQFTVEHNERFLGESPFTIIDPNFHEPSPVYDINFVIHLPIPTNDRSNVHSTVSTPVLIKAICLEDEKEAKSVASEAGSKRKTKFTMKSSNTWKIIGICSFDLMPIVLGEKSYTEKLVLETPEFSFDGTSISWQNLPLLTITVSQDDVPLFPSGEKINFLNLTVESVYNIPQFYTKDLEYKAGTVAYLDSEMPENIIFDGGTWTKYRDVERTKRWNTLSKLQSRAKLSKYKLDCDFMAIKNAFKKEFDIKKKACEDIPRIEWNSVHRCAVRKIGIETMEQHITKYKYWPFQFMIMERLQEANKPKAKEKSTSKIHVYQCYADISELLFPGRRSARVAAQLYTYNPLDITEKVGLEKNIFTLEIDAKDLRDREKKSKTSKHTQSLKSENEESPSIPLTNENGEPTLIVVEIELHEPLIACRAAEDFSSLMKELMPIKQKKSFCPYSGEVAEEQYKNCVQKLVETLTESYRDFCEESKNENSVILDDKQKSKYCFDPQQDELTCFTQFLYKTGAYLSVRNTLRSKVTLLLDQKFKWESSNLASGESQNFIASVYTYLVEQMHVAVNKIVEGRLVSDSPEIDCAKLYYYAEEAYELGHRQDAEHYYKTVVASNKTDCKPWIKYATFLMRIGDFDRAEECCREAIALNGRDKVVLIIYAAILFRNRDYREAEIFLKAVVNLYPRFAEGWAILHLFYIRTDYYPGVDITIRMAEKCMKVGNPDSEITEEEPLAWSMIHCPRNSVYAITATFLLKLYLCELAGIALAEEMSHAGRSTHVLYYMAVEHYLRGRYEDALSHLKEAQCAYGMDYSIGSLMGHCHFRMGDFEKAIDCYEFASMVFNRPDNLHLVEVRLGQQYIVTENYQRAKKVFLSACNSSPTSETWLGAGISFYHLNEFAEAEAALAEANRINNRDPVIWGYLCLLNLSLQRYDEFTQCYREVIKNNLKNRKLWLVITKSMEALGYEAPTVKVASDNENVGDDQSKKEKSTSGTF